jgi:hypothetical protein
MNWDIDTLPKLVADYLGGRAARVKWRRMDEYPSRDGQRRDPAAISTGRNL